MVQVVNANRLTLREVRNRLQLRREFEDSFAEFLTLSPVTDASVVRMGTISESLERYCDRGKVREVQVSALTILPILWEGGYFEDPAVRVSMEENIAEVVVEEEDTVIRGQMDVVVAQVPERSAVPLCVVMIESKNSLFDIAEGLPQLLTYAGTFLAERKFIWGWATNGRRYQFVRIESELYREFPLLDILRLGEAKKLLSILISIRKNLP